MSKEVSPRALAEELAVDPHSVLLLDIRQPHELLISGLENSTNIPMNELPGRLNELDPNAKIVVICRSGQRSSQVTAFLEVQGFRNVRNLTTGMNGWANDVDPSIAKY